MSEIGPVRVAEPCHPYDMNRPGQPDPVNVWEIVDRLTEYELRRLAIAVAIQDPGLFEQRLMEFSAGR